MMGLKAEMMDLIGWLLSLRYVSILLSASAVAGGKVQFAMDPAMGAAPL